MSSEHTQNGSRRTSSGRGGRRSSSGRRHSGSSSFNVSRDEPPAPKKKKTLWESVLGFFGGEKKKAAPVRERETPAPRARAERSERSEGGERSERSERSERAPRSSAVRKPEQVEVTSSRIYVGNLSFDATESDLHELFNGVGTVQNAEVVTNRHTMKSKGFAFVQLTSVDEAKRAVSELHDKDYMGRKLVVSGAKAVEEKRSERPARQPEQ